MTAALAAAGCWGGGGDGPNARISPPPYIATPSPPPVLDIVPSAVTFTTANAAPQQVTIVPLDPSDSNISVINENCTQGHIARLVPSPSPSSNPSSPAPSLAYVASPGKTNGNCTYEFQDAVSTAKGVLTIQNQSNGARTR